MDKENIKTIISETLSSEEFMNGIIEQIQSQIEKEQEKVNEKAKVTKIKKLTNQYKSEKKKTQDMVKNVNKKAINKNQASQKANLTPLYFMPKITTIDDEKICNIYTKFPETSSDINHADMGNNIKRLYSLLSANMNNWDNWYLDGTFNNNIQNTGISEIIDIYFYNFTDDDHRLIKNNKDSIKSYIYIDFDDLLKIMTIYMVNYSDVTHKVYDFYRWTFSPSYESYDEEIKLFYLNLYNYFSNSDNFQKTFIEYMDNLVDEYIIIYKDKRINSIQKEVVENLKDLLLSIIIDYKLIKIDDALDKANEEEDGFDDDKELDVLKEYSESCSEGFKIDPSDNSLKIEINASKDKRDKIKLLLHLALDGFIKVNYNQGDILFNIDGKIISIDNPYWE